MKLLITLAFTLIFSFANAQTKFYRQYSSPLEDNFQAVSNTSDGGFIFTGNCSINSQDSADLYLVKTNLAGDTLWTKTFGGPGYECGFDVKQTSDGGYIVVGNTRGLFRDSLQLLIIKTDASGNLTWSKVLNNGGYNFPNAVFQTADGGYIISNYSSDYLNPSSNLLRIDSNGSLLWAKTVSTANFYIYDMCLTSDGGFGIIGFFSSPYCCQLLKFDSNGNSLWSKSFVINYYDNGNSIALTPDNGFIICGDSYNQGFSNSDCFLIKTDSIGTLQWSKTYGGPDLETANSVSPTSDGGYIFAGTANSFSGNEDVYVVKTNSTGDTLWTKIYGANGNERGKSIIQSPDGGYIIAGLNDAGLHPNTSNAIAIKTDVNGNSGCWNTSTNTIVQTPTAQITSQNNPSGSVTFVDMNPPIYRGGGGTLNTFCNNIGIDDQESERNSLIYPNPSSGNFIVEVKNDNNCTIEIFNLQGCCIFTDKTFSTKKEINLSAQPKGMYFYTVHFKDGKYSSGKLILN
jgi:hypothetical protein